MPILALALVLLAGPAAAAELGGVSFEQDEQGLVHIRYWLDSKAPEALDVGFQVSDDGGRNFAVIPTAVTGDFGRVMSPGEKTAVWDVAKDHPELFCEDCRVAVEARPAPAGSRKARRDMVLILEGPFQMGSAEGEGAPNEHPRRQVFLDAFLIDKFPVTVAQFRAFVQATGRSMPVQPTWNQDVNPVVFVNWNEAEAYCVWAGKRLPTEAEWEKAARGGSDDRYSFGNNEVRLSSHAWFSNNSEGRTHPVGRKMANPFGLFDMGGNAAQWVADWYIESYVGAPTRNPRGPDSGTMRVLRGGSWSSSAVACRAANRDWFFPEGRAETNGFRCAAAANRP
ncbi:MAG: formylglycine-generating enzyme family protein [Elusimicrobia bacterium]|nr:formylglycine-generating enzyme family protein [Elusimicrobiota bacterium]